MEKAITYEYMSISVKREQEPVYVDTYECLGWKLVDSEMAVGTKGFLNTKLSFKRDRKINNKMALNKIEREMGSKFKNIEKLEAQKYMNASINAYGIGLIACVFLALSVFIITGFLKLGSLTMPLQIIFGGVGLLLCIPPYFVYNNTIALKTEQLQPLIDEEYNDISEKCEEAVLLINANRGF